MTDDAWSTAWEAGRDFALIVLENAEYVRRELPGLGLPEELRGRVAEACDDLAGLKHDAFSGLFAAHGEREGSEEKAADRLRRIVDDAVEGLRPLHGLVTDLRGAPGGSLAFVLVAESAANVLRAHARFREAVAALEVEPAPAPRRPRPSSGAFSRRRAAAITP